jgi:hypothetical protein
MTSAHQQQVVRQHSLHKAATFALAHCIFLSSHYWCLLLSTHCAFLSGCFSLFLQVTPGSPAARAGLRPTSRNAAGDLILGDIIQGVDGNAVSSARDLLEQLDAKRVGDEVVVDVLRGGRQRLSFSLQLADRVLGSGTE